MSAVQLTSALVETPGHRTAYLDAGPADGPLMIFVHGWPELGLIWRRQIEHSAAAGWRRIAPDMRGYRRPVCTDPRRRLLRALTETKVAAGYSPMLEEPGAVNAAIDDWLATIDIRTSDRGDASWRAHSGS